MRLLLTKLDRQQRNVFSALKPMEHNSDGQERLKSNQVGLKAYLVGGLHYQSSKYSSACGHDL